MIRKRFQALLAALLILAPGASLTAQQETLPSNIKPALLVIDIQQAFLPAMAEQDLKSAPEVINRAIKLFRAFGLPVVRVYQSDPKRGPKPNSKEFEFPDTILVKAEDPMVIKPHASAFKKTELDRMLKGFGVNTVVCCGLSATGCVLATYHGADATDYRALMLRRGLISPKAAHTEVIESISLSVGLDGLGVILLRAEGPEKALKRLKSIRQSQPEVLASLEPGINQAGYEALGQGFAKEALELFRINTECFPDSWNAWDSLGEIHFGNRTWDEAARCYRKAKAILEKDAKLPPAEKAEQIKRVEGVLLKIQEGRS